MNPTQFVVSIFMSSTGLCIKSYLLNYIGHNIDEHSIQDIKRRICYSLYTTAQFIKILVKSSIEWSAEMLGKWNKFPRDRANTIQKKQCVSVVCRLYRNGCVPFS